jgi:hypothetical protein
MGIFLHFGYVLHSLSHGKKIGFNGRIYFNNRILLKSSLGVNRFYSEYTPTGKAQSSGPGQGRIAVPQTNAIECWRNGLAEYWIWWNWICFDMNGERRDIKTDYHPFLIGNTSLRHHSITPWDLGQPITTFAVDQRPVLPPGRDP